MDINSENHDTYLADWMAGKITDDQLREIAGETDFIAYEKLKHSMAKLQVEEPDLDLNYEVIKQKRIQKLNAPKTRTIKLYNYAAFAAALLIFFGLFQLFIYSNHVETQVGKSSVLTMSDGSTIILNANSSVEYPTLFKYNRKVCLEGEAFFKVEKGRSFKVKTSSGKVEVLGTKFDVIARPGFFEVICFEGKVKVTVGNIIKILTQGEAFRFYQNKIEQWDEVAASEPLWLSNESGFMKSPFQQVIAQLQDQYKLEIEYPKSLANTRFTGSFTHSNIDTALQTICIPLNLKYRKTEAGKFIISE